MYHVYFKRVKKFHGMKLTPPIRPNDDECCGLNCPNCILLVYQVCSDEENKYWTRNEVFLTYLWHRNNFWIMKKV